MKVKTGGDKLKRKLTLNMMQSKKIAETASCRKECESKSNNRPLSCKSKLVNW